MNRTLPRRPVAFATRFAVVVMIIGASACDNVDWGGIQVSLRTPSASGEEAGLETLPAEADSLPSLPDGPVLYAGWRTEGNRVAVSPVAEIQGDSLVALDMGEDPSLFRSLFVRERLPRGSELTLFTAGARIGTLVIDGGGGADTLHCGFRPLVEGTPELAAGNVEADRFLALPKDVPETFFHEAVSALEPDAAARRASVNLLAEVLPQVGAQWPSSTLQARQDLESFRVGEGTAFSATFVYRDQLAVGEAPGTAYSLLILGERPGPAQDYATSYVWYREVAREGKGAPRFWQQLDWDGDGDVEVLFELLGAEDRWWAVLEEGEGESRWARTYVDPCGGSPVPSDGGTAGGSAGS